MVTTDQWLAKATALLAQANIPTSRLDAEIILAHTLRKSRTFLHAHGDQELDIRQRDIADTRLQLRRERTPIAYIIGHKEFYGRLFRVTPATLIPRPESETMITLLKEYATDHAVHELVDVGTGSGCLGITAKLELPASHVSLIDTSRHALKVAETNATHLRVDVQCIHGNLLHEYPYVADVILANLPYVDREWERSPETNYEPKEALFADDHGLALIKKLLHQVPSKLAATGSLFLEADESQHSAIIRSGQEAGLSHRQTRGMIVHLQRQS
ncbi:peptide chain release factor N(5)-glutamine methyltransferase [Streptomyces caniscabiei]|uniref:peptide chain release factor N(5)-glutamine methyltransferase n=1 Tax=Streptomyces caniscabiei TaxID=2746961 RepID=UPI0029AB951D|nr:peptide chain release factor N(5)-glutamine methyltransferase [Streptomyces caniscabiei]MDX2776229.1 peptide chain release factor N(5)-glutamine methyltransferase [Streptomyces caniscabiei]